MFATFPITTSQQKQWFERSSFKHSSFSFSAAQTNHYHLAKASIFSGHISGGNVNCCKKIILFAHRKIAEKKCASSKACDEDHVNITANTTLQNIANYQEVKTMDNLYMT